MVDLWTPFTVQLTTLAWIVVALFVIKMVVLLIKPAAWMGVVDKIYGKPIITIIISAILGYIALTSLLAAGVTLTMIYASMLVLMFLMAMTVAVYEKEMTTMAKKMLKNRGFWKRVWFPILVWIALTVLVIMELLA